MSKEDKRELLLQATLELVARHGFHGAPCAAIAEQAGVAA
ncbi:MAG: TetR family transcriptional regulator, partial [Geobacter sp.]|nr:TetR family transcriptional regulator [Geobacter sp.]